MEIFEQKFVIWCRKDGIIGVKIDEKFPTVWEKISEP